MTASKKKHPGHLPDDIVVVGAGLTGLVLGLSLAHAGYRVNLIDRGDGLPATDTIRTTTINKFSYNHIKSLGVWAEFQRLGEGPVPVCQIRVSDEKTKSQSGRLVPDALINWNTEPSDDPLAWVFQNRQMEEALSSLVHDHPNITITPKTVIQNYSPQHPEWGDTAAGLHTDDDRIIAARLIVAADGSRSPIRSAAGLRAISRTPGQTAIVANIIAEKPHEQLAWQRFIKGGPAALMPIDHDRRMSLVWTLKDDDAQILLSAKPQAFDAALMENFGTGLGGLSLDGERLSWPLSLHHVLRPIANRLVLAGDAAHTIHPLAGQGYNLAVGDAKALADLMIKAKQTGRDIGSNHLLRSYARSRFAETTAMAALTDGLNSVFSFGGPLLTSVTGMGMTLFGASPLKSFAKRVASGGRYQSS
jgi:ubiquinone biosynthesis UbiH/UbiF/VisC/COQ6 family hydroxylase